jgi:ABC-type dipeptide/oligopeptide/nickel transport system ATPase component
VPRLDRPRQAELKPVSGAPPDLAMQIVGCPFAPRCAWRIDVCGSVDPELLPAGEPASQHLAACHNRPTPQEVAAGSPLRVLQE